MFTRRFAKEPVWHNDTHDIRFKRFISCMNKLYRTKKDLKSIAIPEKFGYAGPPL